VVSPSSCGLLSFCRVTLSMVWSPPPPPDERSTDTDPGPMQSTCPAEIRGRRGGPWAPLPPGAVPHDERLGDGPPHVVRSPAPHSAQLVPKGRPTHTNGIGRNGVCNEKEGVRLVGSGRAACRIFGLKEKNNRQPNRQPKEANPRRDQMSLRGGMNSAIAAGGKGWGFGGEKDPSPGWSANGESHNQKGGGLS